MCGNPSLCTTCDGSPVSRQFYPVLKNGSVCEWSIHTIDIFLFVFKEKLGLSEVTKFLCSHPRDSPSPPLSSALALGV